MDKLHGTIVAVLGLLDRSIYRTQIVKFVYLIDEMYYKHFGQTITGLSYMWDSYGPNAIGDAIVNETGELVKLGIIRMSPEPNQYGETSYLYKLEKDDEITSSLTETEKYVINDVIYHYRDFTLPQLITASKRTESFEGVEQYSAIVLKQSSEYVELTKSLKADEGFMRGIEAAVKEMTAG